MRPKKRIALVMQELVQPTEQEFIYSGGDRYTRDLARLIRDLGMEPVIFQRSMKRLLKEGPDGRMLPVLNSHREPMTEFFRTEWEGFQVVALPSENGPDFNLDVAQNTQEFDATVFFHINLAYPRCHKRSVSISHGIWFDHPKMMNEVNWEKSRNQMAAALSCVDHVVSVDTNSINFFGGLYGGRFTEKFILIPNAVDTSTYKPAPEKRDSNRVRVLYPRRHEILRGSTEMERTAEYLHGKYKHVDIHFCGSAHSKDREDALKQWLSGYERIQWYRKSFDEMPQVYQEADIAVIPTIGCEGTSLSLAESMACGLPVVATYIGGLSEMVIDGFNGIKVAPTLDEIKNAVDYLVRNPDERTRMGKNARLVAERFNIEKWQRKWGDLLKDLVR